MNAKYSLCVQNARLWDSHVTAMCLVCNTDSLMWKIHSLQGFGKAGQISNSFAKITRSQPDLWFLYMGLADMKLFFWDLERKFYGLNDVLHYVDAIKEEAQQSMERFGKSVFKVMCLDCAFLKERFTINVELSCYVLPSSLSVEFESALLVKNDDFKILLTHSPIKSKTVVIEGTPSLDVIRLASAVALCIPKVDIKSDICAFNVEKFYSLAIKRIDGSKARG